MIEPWQRTIIRNLFPYSSKKLAVEEAFIAKHPHVPKFLYKYRHFKDNHKASLEVDQLWFSSPDRFNDPFDTTVHFDTTRFLIEDCAISEFDERIPELLGMPKTSFVRKPLIKPIEAKKWQLKMFEALHEQIPKDTRNQLKSFIIERMAAESENMSRLMSDYFRCGFSVLSLSANPLSTLMWSHYSDSHRGFCIEYNFGDLPYEHIQKRMCFPVFYRKKKTDATRYLSHAGVNFNNLFGHYLCLLKSSEWDYEQEWRIVHATGSDHANAALWMPKPSAIIIGADALPNDIEWAQAFCERRAISLKRIVKDIGSRTLVVD